MRTDQDIDNLLERYFRGELTEEEEKQLFEDLRSHPDLRISAMAQACLIKGIRTISQEDQEVLNAAKRTTPTEIKTLLKELHDEERHKGKEQPIRKPTRKIPLWVKWGSIAASIVLIVGVGYDYHQYSVMRAEADDCIEMVTSDLSGEIYMKGGSEEVVKELRELTMKVEQREDLTATIARLEVYYHHATDEYAHEEDAFIDQISLALASAYIYDGQKSKAKDVLLHILNDPDATPTAKDHAQDLLYRINKTFIF